MYKKIIALVALLTNVAYVSAAESRYPATWGSQVNQDQAKDHKHHHHHRDAITDNADTKRLQILDEEDRDGYYYTNLAKWAVALGLTGVGIGLLVDTNKVNNITIASGVVTVGAGVAGLVVGNRETQRAILRSKERADILKRRQSNH